MKYTNENNLNELIAEYEIEYLCKINDVDLHVEALGLDLIEVNEASGIAWNKIRESLTGLTRGILQDNFECIEKNVHNIEVFQGAFNVLQAYKEGLQQSVKIGEQLQAESCVYYTA